MANHVTLHESGPQTIEELEHELAGSRERLKSLADEYETRILKAESHHRLLIDELNHRVRNMLQVVSGLSAQTIKHSSSLEVFAASFQGRIRTLATVYELLSDTNWSNVTLRILLEREVLLYTRNTANMRLHGPDLMLTPKAMQAFGLIFHELSTNVKKHGALSWPAGHVAVEWSVDEKNGLTLKWIETKGPEITEPTKKGFGSELISRQLRYELNGELHYDFARTGLTVTIKVPLDDHLFSVPEAMHESTIA